MIDQKAAVPEEILTLQQLSLRLSRHPRSIKRYVKCGALKEHRIGISPTYLWSEVIKALATGKLRSRKPIPHAPAPPLRPRCQGGRSR